MNRMLCSLVLLVTMSTMGLLVGSKSASAASVTFTDLQEELDRSHWEGSWEGLAEGWSSGSAKLFLVMLGDNAVSARFSIYGSAGTDAPRYIKGTMSGSTMTLTGRTSTTVLVLSRENGVLVLSGDYRVTSGEFVGETGSYYFKKKE